MGFGELDNDSHYGRLGNDFLRGGLGNDTLSSNDGANELQGFDGNERMEGGNQSNKLLGGSRKASKSPVSIIALVTIIGPAIGTAIALARLIIDGGVPVLAISLFAILYIATAIGVEVGFHRYFTHKSFKASAAIETTFAIFGSMAGQGPLLYWVGAHRDHHRFSDTEKDPHTPHPVSTSKVWHAHVSWMIRPPAIRAKALTDLLRQPMVAKMTRTYAVWVLAGLILPTVIGWLAGGLFLAIDCLLWGGLVRIFVQHQFTWMLNSIAHLTGTRQHVTKDRSRNLWWPLAFPTLGASWHNNHHAYPASAKIGAGLRQPDPGAWLIEGLERLGLAWNVRDHRPKDTGEQKHL